MVDLAYFVVFVLFHRAVCRKHELTQYELEMATQDLTSKKQQREELATGVSVHLTTWLNLEISTSPLLCLEWGTFRQYLSKPGLMSYQKNEERIQRKQLLNI